MLKRLAAHQRLSLALFAMAKVAGLSSPLAFLAGFRSLAWGLIAIDAFLLVASVAVGMDRHGETEQGGSI